MLFDIQPQPEISQQGHALIVEYETGGMAWYNRNPHPEAPDARYSGITEGIGYDNSTVDHGVIRVDWQKLGDKNARRLADTHPYKGKSAQAHLNDVADILVPWMAALDVFDKVDCARTYSQCRRAFAGFDELRPNAQAALVSLVFNRGNSMTGPNRSEMRDIRDYGVPNQDYARIASDFRKMTRVWKGTEIYNGMRSRRYAEAKLVETP
jgi:hypothetical protein